MENKDIQEVRREFLAKEIREYLYCAQIPVLGSTLYKVGKLMGYKVTPALKE